MTTTRRYNSNAVWAVADYFGDNFATHLATIDTEEGTSTTEPTAYLEGGMEIDERFPLLEVVDDGPSELVDSLHDMWDHDLSIYVRALSPDVDMLELQKTLRRYLSAIHLTCKADPTMGGNVVDSRLTKTDMVVGDRGDERSKALAGVASAALTVRTDDG